MKNRTALLSILLCIKGVPPCFSCSPESSHPCPPRGGNLSPQVPPRQSLPVRLSCPRAAHFLPPSLAVRRPDARWCCSSLRSCRPEYSARLLLLSLLWPSLLTPRCRRLAILPASFELPSLFSFVLHCCRCWVVLCQDCLQPVIIAYYTVLSLDDFLKNKCSISFQARKSGAVNDCYGRLCVFDKGDREGENPAFN